MNINLLLAFGSGIAFTLIVCILWAHFSKKEYTSIPLNPELVDFWKTSIVQKQEELELLHQIRRAIEDKK